MLLEIEGSPYFRVLKNKYEADYEEWPSQENGVFSSAKDTFLSEFLIGEKEERHVFGFALIHGIKDIRNTSFLSVPKHHDLLPG